MDLSKTEKMSVLLKQLQLSEDDITNYFESSQLVRLEVYKELKKWHFHIQIEKMLPIEVYQVFTTKLKDSFSQIAEVDWTIYTENKENNDVIICDYWQNFLQSITNISPAYKDLIHNQVPTVQNNKLSIIARNEAEAAALRKRLEAAFRLYCSKVGGKAYQLEITVKTEDKALQEFRNQKAKEDKEIILKTVIEKEKREKNGLEKQNKPFSIGYGIPDEPMEMELIQDEERRVTVQGYVFFVDIRKLRSGRSLLIAKATDYTDSLQIKMFSKNDEDVEKFEQLKKGMWVKARGSIQTDMYSNELAMMANDMLEVKVETKADTAPEDKRRVELHAHTTMSQMDAVVSPGRLVEQAAKWGHKAIAITDHAGVQAYPEAHAAGQKNGIKIIYGVEANLVDDGVPIAYNEMDIQLEDATYVVFDVETTGLSAVYDTIIELAGVKIKNGEIIDRFRIIC